MLSINETQQRDGNPGFETLSLLWFERRTDPGRLREALDRLSARHPILTATLSRRWWGTWSWEGEPDRRLALTTQELTSPEEDELLRVCGEILSRRRNLCEEPAVDFHQLFLPDGSEILLMHSNHALMDHQSITLVLQELDRLYRNEPTTPAAEPSNLIAEHRRRFSRGRRLRAFFRSLPDYIWDRWSRRKTWPRQLPVRELQRTDGPATLRIVSARLDAAETVALNQAVQQMGTIPSISMAILGSLFSAFAAGVPNPRPGDRFRTGLGAEIARQNLENFHPQNASSVLRLSLTREEISDRNRRYELLNQRFLEVLRSRNDLGIVEANSLFYPCYPLVRRVAGQMIRRAFSFFYAYFDVPAEFGREFAGVPLREVRYLGPAWSPPGMTLLVTGFRGELEFALTYVSQQITDQQARELLAATVEELRELSRVNESGDAEASPVSYESPPHP